MPLLPQQPQLEGPLPPLPESLWVADLNANNFSGKLPPLDTLPNLEAFLVGVNSFEGPLPPLPPFLAVLDASYNRLSGARQGCQHVGRTAAGTLEGSRPRQHLCSNAVGKGQAQDVRRCGGAQAVGGEANHDQATLRVT